MRFLMKVLLNVSGPVAAVILSGFSGSALSDVTVKAVKEDVIIVVHSDGKYSVYGGDSKEILQWCSLCKLSDTVDSCQKQYKKKDLCLGTVDTTVQWVTGFSVLHMRTTKSPDVCYKEVCMGGSCKVYSYDC